MAEKLSAGAIGADVARLHEQLQRHNCEVPAQEVRRKFFGPGTREAVLTYQRQQRLECSGDVDESTTAVLYGKPPPPAGGTATPAATAGPRGTRARATGEHPTGSSLYERLGGIFAIAAIIDRFSDALVQNPIVGRQSQNPALRDWHTNNLGRLPGLKWERTAWLAEKAGGPVHSSATRPGGLEEAHHDLCITSEEFDAVATELARTLDAFDVPEPEKQEVLGAFAAHKDEVTEGSRAAKSGSAGPAGRDS